MGVVLREGGVLETEGTSLMEAEAQDQSRQEQRKGPRRVRDVDPAADGRKKRNEGEKEEKESKESKESDEKALRRRGTTRRD